MKLVNIAFLLRRGNPLNNYPSIIWAFLHSKAEFCCPIEFCHFSDKSQMSYSILVRCPFLCGHLFYFYRSELSGGKSQFYKDRLDRLRLLETTVQSYYHDGGGGYAIITRQWKTSNAIRGCGGGAVAKRRRAPTSAEQFDWLMTHAKSADLPLKP